MTTLDVLLLLLLVGFAWFGFWFGLIHAVGGLAGTVLGAWLAGHYYAVVSAPFETLFAAEGAWLKLFFFLAIFIFVNRLIGFGFYLLDRTFAFLTRMPFLKTIDRLSGAVLGLVEGAFVIGLTLVLASQYLELSSAVEQAIASSRIAFGLTAFAGVLVPLLPEFVDYARPYLPPGVNLPAEQPPVYGR